MIVWLHGPDTGHLAPITRELLTRWPRALLLDPEWISRLCQEHLLPAPVPNVQAVPVWRHLLITAADGLLHGYDRPVIMPWVSEDPEAAARVFQALDALSWPVRHVAVDLPEHHIGWLAGEITVIATAGRPPASVAEEILALVEADGTAPAAEAGSDDTFT